MNETETFRNRLSLKEVSVRNGKSSVEHEDRDNYSAVHGSQ